MHNPNVAVITQARMTSTRLPGKIMLPVNGEPLLAHHLRRLNNRNWQIWVATTSKATDDVVQDFCTANQMSCYRGSELNVLDRFYQTAIESGSSILVRVTSDCPLIDAALIQNGIDVFVAAKNDFAYVSNCFPRTYARGFDFEIFSIHALEDAYKNASQEFDMEHVTPYLWKNKSGLMQLINMAQTPDNSHMRLCVDTSEDFVLIKELIEKHDADKMNWQHIEALMNQHPELVAINKEVEQKKN
ncbi:MAG: cytidylyltransferase domain-containing protein [Flavobacteriales bacterium]